MEMTFVSTKIAAGIPVNAAFAPIDNPTAVRMAKTLEFWPFLVQ